MASLYSSITFALLLSSVSSSPIVARSPTPPNIPLSSSATTLLNGLTVAAQGPQTGYSRDLFPTWNTISGTCNTRETVLKRDGTGVVVSDACTATSGSWFSPYDGATWTAASDVDIDHVVPLSNAWKVSFYPPRWLHQFISPPGTAGIAICRLEINMERFLAISTRSDFARNLSIWILVQQSSIAKQLP